MYDINIIPVLNGYVVRVGCQTVVFESRVRLLNELSRYFENPNKVSQEYLTGSLNSEALRSPGIQPAPSPERPMNCPTEAADTMAPTGLGNY